MSAPVPTLGPCADCGTYAGWQQHHKAKEDPCEPCKVAQRRYHKRMKYRLATVGPERIPLGEEAHRIIANTGRRELSRLTGLNDSYLSKLYHGGPERIVYRRNRDIILATRPPATAVGIHRRLQALHALGYSAAHVAREIGTCTDAVRIMLRSTEPRAFHHQRVTEAVVAAYARLAYAPMPQGRSAQAARNRAAGRGYAPPLAWDDADLDDPSAEPYRAPELPQGRPDMHRAEDIEFLRSMGETDEAIATRLGITRETVRDIGTDKEGLVIPQLVPAWHEQAACNGMPTELWFPETRGQAKRSAKVAVSVCSGCPVQTTCLTTALERHERWGIWGGRQMGAK